MIKKLFMSAVILTALISAKESRAADALVCASPVAFADTVPTTDGGGF
jgi:hypothetical protein